MQSRSHQKFVAVILSNDMGSELYPLTKNFPKSNLSVGNKKLIIYQLEQLQSVIELTIIIICNQEGNKVKQFVQLEFLPNNPTYPHKIDFFWVQNNQSEYSCLQQLLAEGFEEVQGIIVLPVDVISSIKFQTVLQEHIAKKSDVTLLIKQKKEFGKDEKKPDYDFEPEIDISLLSEEGEVHALRNIENYDYDGFDLPASVYHKISKASFEKTIDSRVYILSQRVIKIIKNLVNDEISFLKIDLIDTLVRNQSNTNLLDYIQEKCRKPLKIFAQVYGQNEYIRRVNNLKIYENMNLDSLIRGPKQKQVLMPNSYTQPIDEKAMNQFKGCLIGSGCQLQRGIKLTRTILENGCKVGKGVQIANSIVMGGSIIEDGCKISNSTIGPNCLIKSQSTLVSCQLASGCTVEAGTNNQKQILIPLQ